LIEFGKLPGFMSLLTVTGGLAALAAKRPEDHGNAPAANAISPRSLVFGMAKFPKLLLLADPSRILRQQSESRRPVR
jgi:hypothetical protein